MRPLRFIALLLACGSAATPAWGEDSAPPSASVFASGQDGYHTYRIPALVVSPKGALLALCEGRKTSQADHGDVDLVLKRSEDGGQTWSRQTLVHEEGGEAKITIGNPCPVVDHGAGVVWLPFTRENDRVFMMHSKDDGATWSEPVEITASVKAPEWGWYATGPGHGIQLQRGRHKGRLVIPCDCRIGPGRDQWNTNGHSLVIYSDDHGQTWQRGEITGPGMNECEAVELADGSLLLSMRNYRGKNQRAFAVSKDGGQTWSEPQNHEQVYCPTCQASIHRHSLAPQSVILYSGPGGPGRANLTIRASLDEGKSWPVSKRLHEGPSAYSDLAVLPDGRVAVLYEGGQRQYHEGIRFAAFPLNWLLEDGANVK